MYNMVDKEQKHDSIRYIARVQKQHSSLVVSIPKALRTAMDIKKGDAIIFKWCSTLKRCEFQKL